MGGHRHRVSGQQSSRPWPRLAAGLNRTLAMATTGITGQQRQRGEQADMRAPAVPPRMARSNACATAAPVVLKACVKQHLPDLWVRVQIWAAEALHA